MFIKLIRIGRDAELRYTPNGKAVCNVVGAYDVGYGDKKRTQWIEGVLWEKRAEKLAEYLTRGQQAVVTFDDIEVETFEGTKGFSAKLKGRVVDLQLCGAKPSETPMPLQGQSFQQEQARKVPAQPQPAAQPAPQPVDDPFDDDIPF